MKLLLIFSLFFSTQLLSKEISESIVFKLDWMMDEAILQMRFDRKKMSEIVGDKKYILVLWQSDSQDSLNLTPLFNKLAIKLKNDYKMIAYAPLDDYVFIKRFKKHLLRDFLQPKEELLKFLKNFIFISDLDKNLNGTPLEGKRTGIFFIENNKIVKEILDREDLLNFLKDTKK